MEGTPVRGHHRGRIVQLNQARDLQSLHVEIVRLISAELQNAEVFFGNPLPAWLRPHLDSHPGLSKKLEEGELVGIAHTDDPMPRPASAKRSIVLVPVINDGVLYGVIGVMSPMDGPHTSPDDIETVRQFAHEVGPVVARLTEIEKLRLEIRELTEAKKTLQAVIQMRSHLQSNVAHELRTPLAAIRGYARMILDGRGGEINDKQKEYLRIVTDNTNRLINLVSWMSHVAGLSEQHFTVNTFDLRQVWNECLEANRELLDSKAITVTQQTPLDRFFLTGDREKLAYVFDQLITSAVMLANHRGQITAEFSRGREREVSVKISGDGAGIPSEVLSKIFERSVNTIPTATNVDSATINLSGVYDVVAMHGGRMFVNSAAGKGSTFLFTLPAVKFDGEEKLA